MLQDHVWVKYKLLTPSAIPMPVCLQTEIRGSAIDVLKLPLELQYPGFDSTLPKVHLHTV